MLINFMAYSCHLNQLPQNVKCYLAWKVMKVKDSIGNCRALTYLGCFR